MRQKNGSLKPVRKVAAGAVGGAVATILIWVLQESLGRSIPGDVAAAITTVVVFLVSYITPAGKEE